MEARIVEFAEVLRQNGVRVATSELLDASRAATLIDLSDREAFRAVLRTTMVKRSADRAPFDRAFDVFFSGAVSVLEGVEQSLLDELAASGALEGDERTMTIATLNRLLGEMSAAHPGGAAGRSRAADAALPRCDPAAGLLPASESAAGRLLRPEAPRRRGRRRAPHRHRRHRGRAPPPRHLTRRPRVGEPPPVRRPPRPRGRRAARGRTSGAGTPARDVGRARRAKLHQPQPRRADAGAARGPTARRAPQDAPGSPGAQPPEGHAQRPAHAAPEHELGRHADGAGLPRQAAAAAGGRGALRRAPSRSGTSAG